jgi:hypothetical protein
MRRSTPALVAAAAFLASSNVAAAAPVARAGEWESTVGARKVIICLKHDRSFDSIASLTTRMPQVKCGPVDYHSAGPVGTFTVTCEVAGGRLTSHGTIISTGPDSYTSHVTSHMVGGQMAMPDMDMVQTGRRLGECKPGDRVSPD